MVPRCGRRSRRWRIRSLGMPGGVGGTHAGPAAMLTEVWTPIARRFAARPVPERFLSCDGGEMVVLGHYRGQPPGSGHPFVAPCAHELAFRDGRIAELRQITDTQQWVNAARNGAVGLVEGIFAAVARRDGGARMDTYAPDVAITEPSSLPLGGVYHGHDGAAEHARGFVPVGTRGRHRRIARCGR